MHANAWESSSRRTDALTTLWHPKRTIDFQGWYRRHLPTGLLEVLRASVRTITSPGPITSVHSVHVLAPLVLIFFQASPAACMARWPSGSRILVMSILPS